MASASCAREVVMIARSPGSETISRRSSRSLVVPAMEASLSLGLRRGKRDAHCSGVKLLARSPDVGGSVFGSVLAMRAARERA